MFRYETVSESYVQPNETRRVSGGAAGAIRRSQFRIRPVGSWITVRGGVHVRPSSEE